MSSIIFNTVDDLFLKQAQARSDSFSRLVSLRDAPPIQAPNHFTITDGKGGIGKPIDLQEVADEYDVSPSMAELKGKGPAPEYGRFGLDIFEGEGKTKRIVGRTYLDRWDDLINDAGLFQRPDYSWDNNVNTHIGNPTGLAEWSGNVSNSAFFVFGLLANPRNVVSIKKITVQFSMSLITVDDTPSIGYWVPQYQKADGSWGFGKPWQAKSSETVRHIKSSGYRVVSNGAIDPTGWPDTDDWYGVKSWVANGFYMNFTNKSYDDSPSPDKEAALAHSFYVDIDITVKENEEGGISL